jgi:hypothetical protein
MKNLEIENQGNQLILGINRKGFDENYLISLLKRLQVEELAQKSDYKSEILRIVEQINQDWWDKNREIFLKGVN